MRSGREVQPAPVPPHGEPVLLNVVMQSGDPVKYPGGGWGRLTP